jgi:FAD:protein FMN transferase
MGMPITIYLTGGGNRPEAILDSVFQHFKRVDEVYSPFKPNSQISRLNSASVELSAVSSEIKEVLLACETAKQSTNGFFDVWRDGRLDPSGYVKGWAIDGAAKIIQSQGIHDFFVDAGGDIQAGGRNDNGALWRVGIKHPERPGKFVKVICLQDQAIATSGTYERGKHIFNPHTGLSIEDPVSLSVIGKNIIEVDVLATAAFAMGPEAGLKFVADLGFEGLAITKHGQVLMTDGFERYVV